jgi:hypothetical protein
MYIQLNAWILSSPHTRFDQEDHEIVVGWGIHWVKRDHCKKLRKNEGGIIAWYKLTRDSPGNHIGPVHYESMIITQNNWFNTFSGVIY